MIGMPVKQFSLVEIRERLGLSVAEVAERIGICADTLRKWEQKEQKPSLDNFVKLCKAYGISVNWIQLVD